MKELFKKVLFWAAWSFIMGMAFGAFINYKLNERDLYKSVMLRGIIYNDQVYPLSDPIVRTINR